MADFQLGGSFSTFGFGGDGGGGGSSSSPVEVVAMATGGTTASCVWVPYGPICKTEMFRKDAKKNSTTVIATF